MNSSFLESRGISVINNFSYWEFGNWDLDSNLESGIWNYKTSTKGANPNSLVLSILRLDLDLRFFGPRSSRQRNLLDPEPIVLRTIDCVLVFGIGTTHRHREQKEQLAFSISVSNASSKK